MHRQSHLEIDHKQTIRYHRPRSVTFGIERVLDKRRQHPVDSWIVLSLIPAPVQQDMRQSLMMSQREFVGLPPNEVRPAFDVVQNSERGLQVPLLSRGECRGRSESGALVQLLVILPLRNVLPGQTFPLKLKVDERLRRSESSVLEAPDQDPRLPRKIERG